MVYAFFLFVQYIFNLIDLNASNIIRERWSSLSLHDIDLPTLLYKQLKHLPLLIQISLFRSLVYCYITPHITSMTFPFYHMFH
jgi:hypothetical protein